MHGGHIVLKIVVNMMKCDVCIGLTFLFEHRHLTNVSLLLLGLSFIFISDTTCLRMLISSTGKFQNRKNCTHFKGKMQKREKNP